MFFTVGILTKFQYDIKLDFDIFEYGFLCKNNYSKTFLGFSSYLQYVIDVSSVLLWLKVLMWYYCGSNQFFRAQNIHDVLKHMNKYFFYYSYFLKKIIFNLMHDVLKHMNKYFFYYFHFLKKKKFG